MPIIPIAKKLVNRWRRLYHLRRHSQRVVHQVSTAPRLPYNEHPRVTAVLQLFNKRHNVEAILAALHSSPIEEIIVIDDGSRDGALEILPALLAGKNHFIIRSNDLFEIRTYSRALDFARGEIVALLQDDDIPPMGGAWIHDALQLFDQYPQMAVLGGRDGLELKLADSRDPEQSPHQVTYRAVNQRDGERIDMPFRFVDVVNRAPMLLRRRAVQQLGGIDNTFAPFQCDDVDLCLRAWKAGLQVGLYSTAFLRDVGMGGMRLFNAGTVPVQARKNWQIIYDRYHADIANGVFTDLVAEARGSLQLQR